MHANSASEVLLQYFIEYDVTKSLNQYTAKIDALMYQTLAKTIIEHRLKVGE